MDGKATWQTPDNARWKRKKEIHKCKYTYSNTQIQIHKYKYANTNTQIQIHEYKYKNTNTRIQIHKYKYKYTNTNNQMQIQSYSVLLTQMVAHVGDKVKGVQILGVVQWDPGPEDNLKGDAGVSYHHCTMGCLSSSESVRVKLVTNSSKILFFYCHFKKL